MWQICKLNNIVEDDDCEFMRDWSHFLVQFNPTVEYQEHFHHTTLTIALIHHQSTTDFKRCIITCKVL
jgi:hypothetical protein